MAMTSFSDYSPDGPRRESPGDLAYAVGDRAQLEGLAALYAARERVPSEKAQLWANQVFERLDGGLGQLVTASSAGQIVGYGLVDWMSREPAPEGFYLMGLVVHPAFRRMGIGRELTQQRLDWVRARTDSAYYIANALNQATIDLHDAFGFREVERVGELAGVSFEGGVGILSRVSFDDDATR